MPQRVMILGKRLAALRHDRYLTQEEFAQQLAMSSANVRRLEQAPASGMQAKNFRRLAALLELAPEELQRRIGMTEHDSQPAQGLGPRELPPHQTALPTGLRADTIQPIVDVPHFHGVSATRIEDRTADPRGVLSIPSGPKQRFAVTVDGDCMEPRYRDGDVVVFSIDAAEREGIVDGKSYFVQFTDGQNTFKRIFLDAGNREALILRPWNPRYPESTIDRSSIKVLARAVCRFVNEE